MSCTNGENKTQMDQRIALLEDTLMKNERALEALKDSEKRYRRLFESAKDGILILNADTGKIVDVNPFLVNLLGYSYDELFEKHIWEIGEFKDIAASKEAFKTLQDNEYIRYEDLPLQTRAGHRKDVEFVSNVYLVDHTKVIQCNIRDITERKALEDQFRQAQKMEAVGLLAGGVAHDFNNMLSVILGYTEISMNQVKPDDSLYDNLEEIFKAATRSSDITQQLLAFARKQTIIPVVLDINKNVDKMLKMLRRLIGENINLKWLPANSLWPVKMDPIQVNQILANLCVNARDAIVNIGNVTIETGNVVFEDDFCSNYAGYIAGEYVMIAVSDNGCGIDEKIVDKIFDPFFTSKGVGRGTGLGLSTVHGIIKQNKGFIKVYSKLGKGTTFKIYLPRHTEQFIDTQLEKADAIPLGHGETLLIVEDEPALLSMGKIMLEQLGYRVIAACAPKEAINLAAEHKNEISLLITDVIMPEMNGLEMSKQLKFLFPNMKILFMSGYTANIIVHSGVLDDGVNFIQKPFSMKDLAIKVRDAINVKKDPVSVQKLLNNELKEA